jgi:hypothetical protein
MPITTQQKSQFNFICISLLQQGFSTFSISGATHILSYQLTGHKVTNYNNFVERQCQIIKNVTNLGLLLQTGLHTTPYYSLTHSIISETSEIAFALVLS